MGRPGIMWREGETHLDDFIVQEFELVDAQVKDVGAGWVISAILTNESNSSEASPESRSGAILASDSNSSEAFPHHMSR